MAVGIRRVTVNMYVGNNITQYCVLGTWVIGDSHLVRARIPLSHAIVREGPIAWRVKGGSRWPMYREALDDLLTTALVHPRWMIVHLGGNDLGQSTTRMLYDDIHRDLIYTHLRLPDTIIVWSWMLPRVNWRKVDNIPKLETGRKTLNRRLANRVRELGGQVARHDTIDHKPQAFLRDGVHLTPEAQDRFVTDISSLVVHKDLLLHK